ncbi:MAG: DUF1365 family protein [Candidatus Omnitrophica bacterium]|nr:DUF1365 family protein [Candidatus Omnitrophota bacterium]
MRSKILLCELVHARFAPVRHSFRYPMTLLILDLDEIETLERKVPLFGHNRFSAFSIHEKDYVLGGKGPLRQKITDFLRSKDYPAPEGRIELVTAPRYFGTVFNPVSFYYVYTPREDLQCVVAEVNNTVGERHFYVLTQKADPRPGFLAHYWNPIEFFISPFMKAEGDYEFHFSTLEDRVDIRVTDHRNGKIFFFARFFGNTVPLTNGNLAKMMFRHPLLGAMTFPRILWQAVILLTRKRLPVYDKPEPSHPRTYRLAPPSPFQNLCLKAVLRYFSHFDRGELTVILPNKSALRFGTASKGRRVALHVHNYDFFKRLFFSGDIGFGESFTAGEWGSPDVTELLLFFADNLDAVNGKMPRGNFFTRALVAALHRVRENSLRGSRKNIREHYDLGNAFYQLFLDPTLTYSCGIFDTPSCSLERAQENKLDSILAKAAPRPEDHILEIGCGWGGWAVRAAQKTGCRVTGITLSEEQRNMAVEKVAKAGLQEKISILLKDYREVEGSFDKIVSIEMLEAVGHDYLGLFFQNCDRCLKPGGRAVFQVITIPDARYEDYRKRPDWIQKHIFPGGMLPSSGALQRALASTRLRIVETASLAPHYAKTLAAWRARFNEHSREIAALGFDEAFRRKWNYYFHYCEAGFASGMIDVIQMVLARQNGPGPAGAQ